MHVQTIYCKLTIPHLTILPLPHEAFVRPPCSSASTTVAPQWPGDASAAYDGVGMPTGGVHANMHVACAARIWHDVDRYTVESCMH